MPKFETHFLNSLRLFLRTRDKTPHRWLSHKNRRGVYMLYESFMTLRNTPVTSIRFAEVSCGKLDIENAFLRAARDRSSLKNRTFQPVSFVEDILTILEMNKRALEWEEFDALVRKYDLFLKVVVEVGESGSSLMRQNRNRMEETIQRVEG